MKTTKTTIVSKEFDKENLFVEIEKCLEFKHPFTLVSDKTDVTKFKLEYMTQEVIDDAQSND